jgi:hypothetical protein
MKRRDFIQSSSLAGVLGATALLNASAAEKPDAPSREIYELQVYHLRRGPKQKLFEDFFRDAAIPAMNRTGIGPVGVFGMMIGPDSPSAYVLLPHKSLEAMVSAKQRFYSDADFLKSGADFLNAPASDPAYIRVESSLMMAFEGMPKLEIPAATAEKKPRIFELRTYESHGKKANLKKIEMFNQGEIAIFRRNGLAPVFFGETLIGAKLPNLTYMLTFESMAARDKNWSAFGGDPEWKKLSTTPGYTDPEIVSNISNMILRPASCSQI